MGLILTDSANYTAIANAIRSKTGGSQTYTPGQMATAIGSIETGSGGEKMGGFGSSCVEVLLSWGYADSELQPFVSKLSSRASVSQS